MVLWRKSNWAGRNVNRRTRAVTWQFHYSISKFQQKDFSIINIVNTWLLPGKPLLLCLWFLTGTTFHPFRSFSCSVRGLFRVMTVCQRARNMFFTPFHLNICCPDSPSCKEKSWILYVYFLLLLSTFCSGIWKSDWYPILWANQFDWSFFFSCEKALTPSVTGWTVLLHCPSYEALIILHQRGEQGGKIQGMIG